MSDDQSRSLGRIEGKLDMLIAQHADTNTRLGKMDGRLRDVEMKAATNGAVTGGLVSVGVALVIEVSKHVTGL
ncbi:hypothetical protein [Nitrosovibrio sp. Nv4]|uniref:hypothetical protein n=1 Tax=Nitrosovibrio sp. Nv4 TaxID=1945880 RepID=UPI000BDB368D|nr:hypothetical protein [Nitrosovibrio sp. Nv4]SOD42316.1 hypothetical protein SAMN06298226_2654 [Nitrosovibrio sp. Nv4]